MAASVLAAAQLSSQEIKSSLAGIIEQITIPLDAGCCGFAGDRGFLFPELTQAATQHEAAEVKAKHPDECYSSSRTCEIGMSRATGQIYRSYMYLLEKTTR